ncbi:MAG: MarC family protein [Verrucomicrobiales bacterium]
MGDEAGLQPALDLAPAFLFQQEGLNIAQLELGSAYQITSTSLQAILGTTPPASSPDGERDLAIAPLAFPTLVPPYAVGVIILFAPHFSQTTFLLQIVGLAVGLMLLEWLAMTFADRILRVRGPTTLKVLGSVFGVLQLSLGIELILHAVKPLRD